MRLKNIYLLLFITVFTLSCEKDESYKAYSNVLLTETWYNGVLAETFEYNLLGQVEKSTYRDSYYHQYDYDNQGRLVKKSSYYGPYFQEYLDELASYDTLIYESNKIIQKTYNDNMNEGVFELAYYTEYRLNSQNECKSLISYTDDHLVHDSTEYTWSNGNLVEYTLTYNDGNWRHGIYEYDNEHNPFALCTNILDPWLRTKNNRTRMIIAKSYEEEIDTIICSYTYNEYGFPVNVSTTWSTNPDNTIDESYTYEIE